jgi:hypothetical protein
MNGSGKWIGPKRYEALTAEEKTNWNPAWKEYREEIKQEMQYCEECGHETGMEDVVTRIPIGEPYRYYQAGPMQRYFSKKLLEQSQNPITNGSLGGSKTISFTRHSPLANPNKEVSHG